ncbi:membrane-bound lytic murein transglycosylase B [Microbacteriaceae bacterium SG_E_30_P1]|uniref:Membrane-bound lytic murein transglycosylase B n=1 Tax=Antiquaquibacter oligotrophicus TaxID=2880260 RepID=A0ABT6KQ57_9MICO|nr:lytic murein transglycosylase [Antiquaquibacter oligotrophicus]MDH6181999.1 membrane-bound lytic murein transglycosylase B [Antiquaquibacter oligotrophicus]UDF12332.1 lytic murein transglycosylase [Antiquaquibacter oligotrophicus]
MVARWVPFAAGAGALAVVATVAVVALAPRETLPPAPTDAPDLLFATQAAAPPLAAEPTGPGPIGLIDPTWVESTAAVTGIPHQAVLAYAGAVVNAEENFPGCGIGWNTLAGIGYAESDHGRHGGATFEENGHVSPKIFGVPLDGTTTEEIPDTDGGEFDETADIDRAIGPMQLIPSSWRSFPSDGNGDGVPDPHNIYDAAVAAANYLCRASGDFTTREGWAAGVAAYNSAGSYTGIVATAAQSYYDASVAG